MCGANVIVGLRIMFACVALLFATLPAHAQNKLALIIGNTAYAHLPVLANPANDAKLLDENLRQLGFTVTAVTNQSQFEMKSAIAQFAQSVAASGPDTIALFYYAGHGVQIDGTNYLVPIDANVNSAGDVVLGAVSASDLLKTLELANAKVNVLVLDACRDNPFKGSTRGFSRGLARVEAPAGSIVAYATAPGQVAQDGDTGNSPYAEALSRNIATPGLALEEVFRKVRIDVSQKTDGGQVPWEETSLTQEVILAEAAVTAEPVGVVAPKTTTLDPALEASRAFLLAVAANSIEAYDAFLQKYPTAKETPQAMQNLTMLSDEKHWRDAVAQNTLGAYKIYLNLNPQGSYAAEAKDKIATLQLKPKKPAESAAIATPPAQQPALERMVQSIGFDVFGSDINSIKNLSFAACSEVCAGDPNCAAASYRSDLQRCYLKSSATLVVLNGKADMAIKAKVRNSVRISDFELLPQTDVPGGDLFPNSVKTKSAQGCLEVCETTTGCNAFSFVTSNKACWLKSGAGSVLDNPPVVSGRRIR